MALVDVTAMDWLAVILALPEQQKDAALTEAINMLSVRESGGQEVQLYDMCAKGRGNGIIVKPILYFPRKVLKAECMSEGLDTQGVLLICLNLLIL